MTDPHQPGQPPQPNAGRRPEGYSAEGVRPSWTPPPVVTPDWAKELADARQAPPPPPPRRTPNRAKPEPPPPKPPTAAQLRWRRIEFPAVFIIVLVLVVSLGLISHQVGSGGDSLPHNNATQLWPVDATAHDVAYTVRGETHPGTSEQALFVGYATFAALPAPMIGALYRPEGDVETAHFWRQTDVRFTDLDRRIQLRRATDEGTELYAVAWGDNGGFFGPPILEVPADVTVGDTWESSGDAGLQVNGWRDAMEYHNTSNAEAPTDPELAQQGCLLINSETTVGVETLQKHAVWCPGEGIVRETGSWGGNDYALEPADPPPVSDEVRRSLPLPAVTGADPQSWATGWVDPPTEEDDVFGIGEPVFVATIDPVVSDVGYISTSNQLTGDVTTFDVAAEETEDYPEGTARLQWRARPGGDLTALGTHGGLVTAATIDRKLSLIGGNGARRWTTELSEVAVAAPVSLGPDRLAVATLDGRVHLLDVGTGEEIWSTSASDQGISLQLATDGRTIAAVDAANTLILLDAETGEVLADDFDLGQPVNDMELVDGTVILAAGRIAGIDARTGTPRWRMEMSVPDSVVVSGDRVAVGSAHETRILRADNGEEIREGLPASDSTVGLTGGFALLTGGEVLLIDQDGSQRHRWSMEGTPVTSLTVGSGRIWAFNKDSMTGWWVQP